MYFGPEEETIIRQYIGTRDESLYRGKRENIHESMMKNLARRKRSFRKHKIIPLKRSGEL